MGENRRISWSYWAKLGLLAPLLLLSLCSPSWGLSGFSTQKTVVYYSTEVDLDEMERRLRFTPAENLYHRYFVSWPAAHSAFAPRLAAKIDGLLAEVRRTLGLWPEKAAPLRIVLLRDGRAVSQRYLALRGAKERPLFGYRSLEGFYESLTHTIFLSLADLHAGILAHEMAHFVLCTAFPAPPPPQMQDDWANFVETRLGLTP